MVNIVIDFSSYYWRQHVVWSVLVKASRRGEKQSVCVWAPDAATHTCIHACARTNVARSITSPDGSGVDRCKDSRSGWRLYWRARATPAHPLLCCPSYGHLIGTGCFQYGGSLTQWLLKVLQPTKHWLLKARKLPEKTSYWSWQHITSAFGWLIQSGAQLGIPSIQ